MNNSIIDLGQLVSMSSYEFLTEVISPARTEAGEAPVRNDQFLARAMSWTIAKKRITPRGGGRQMESITLTGDQLLLVSMRESKAARRKVLDYIRRIEKDKQLLEDQKKRAAIQPANRRGCDMG